MLAVMVGHDLQLLFGHYISEAGQSPFCKEPVNSKLNIIHSAIIQYVVIGRIVFNEVRGYLGCRPNPANLASRWL